jgi:hypothetical protein
MAAVIVGVDFASFRNRFWERLTVNIGICPGVSRFLLEIPQASMSKARLRPFATIARREETCPLTEFA